MFFESCSDVLTAGLHGSTFGGNPLAAAGACHVLSRIDAQMLQEVREKSEYIFDTLSLADGVKSVSGMGLMIGIETEADASAVVGECMKRGVLVIKAKNKVRLLPALNIPWELLCRAVKVILEVASELK